MNSRSVLLIEDNLMNMELATDLLEAAGFHVLKAENAEDGISMAVAQQPDIILMDIALPGMDGLEATKRIKQDARTVRIPIVALTASAMRGDDNKARLAGCCGYIAKPIDTRLFAKTVTAFIEKEGT
ncbi:MAG: response regulator [Syntrophaceae bacterium]|nr:response regulator [Syntrophaceae bacterium]